jgi:tetratricopeptide (TPR) repeat protein
MSEIDELIRKGHLARREDRPGDAGRFFEEAVARCREAGTPDQLVRALKGLGQIQRDLGRGDAALPLYEEAVKICRAGNDTSALAHTVRHVGDIHREAGRADLAGPCYDEALALYRADERTDPLDLANAIRPLAILKEQTGKTEEARHLWEEARNLYASANVPAGVRESAKRLDRLG